MVFCFNKGNIQWTYGNWSDLASVQTASQFEVSNDFLCKNNFFQGSYVQPISFNSLFKQVDFLTAG